MKPLTVAIEQPWSGRRSGKRFWREKLAANVRRDRWVTRQLRRQGWRVVRIWEHELAQEPQRCVVRIRAALGRTQTVETTKHTKHTKLRG